MNPDPVILAGSLIAFSAAAGRDVEWESVELIEPLDLACGRAPGLATGGLLRHDAAERAGLSPVMATAAARRMTHRVWRRGSAASRTDR